MLAEPVNSVGHSRLRKVSAQIICQSTFLAFLSRGLRSIVTFYPYYNVSLCNKMFAAIDLFLLAEQCAAISAVQTYFDKIERLGPALPVGYVGIKCPSLTLGCSWNLCMKSNISIWLYSLVRSHWTSTFSNVRLQEYRWYFKMKTVHYCSRQSFAHITDMTSVASYPIKLYWYMQHEIGVPHDSLYNF